MNEEERIRERAYKIWLDEGCPDGRSEDHWDMARELIAIEDNTPLTLKPVPIEREPSSVDGSEEPPVVVGGDVPTRVDQEEQQYPPPTAR
jgi:hypothetical protein